MLFVEVGGGGGRKILGNHISHDFQREPRRISRHQQSSIVKGGGGGEEGGGRKWYHKKITQTEPESFSPPPQSINNDPSLATPITECIEVKPRECRLFIFYSKTNKT